MKKKALVKSLLILLPVLAVGLATTMDSVIVFDAAAGITSYYSYFDLIPVTSLQNLPPLAGLLCAVCGICAVHEACFAFSSPMTFCHSVCLTNMTNCHIMVMR